MYSFPLQKVLDYRKNREDEEQRRLSQAAREAEAARATLVSLQDDLSRLQEDVLLSHSGQIDVQHARLTCDYTVLLAGRVKEGEQLAARSEARLREQLLLTEKSWQERKVMDKLRERGEMRFLRRLNQIEQRENDEIARIVCRQHKRQD
ncbi:MAG: flagellar FliJ family protein [Dethiobacter sp.]|nr:flagellar FliJ family protein [Dethiobacter sp.]MBS3897285.1 flagellar FliJ family protein [Dethiobacter sp.]MBS3982303.1 flagellar FliJ family protein [Dethiobacter sp.]MCL4464394.1 flagellar FliJ family protein [Bacillota bacterium]MCL5992677.1 flagellar FliJ family protein [Bacillota bacterium]